MRLAMEQDILTYVGKSLYQTHILKEMKRYVVFRTRCKMHSSAINDLLSFFKANEHRQAWLKGRLLSRQRAASSIKAQLGMSA